MPILAASLLVTVPLAPPPQDVVPALKLRPAPAAPMDDVADELQELLDEYDAALVAFKERFQAADESEQRALYEKEYPDPNAWAPRVLAIADAHPGTDVAAEALAWVATRTYGEHQQPAVERLVAQHFGSESMKEVVFVLTRSEGGEGTLRRLIAESPHRAVQGMACLALAMTKERPRDRSQEWADHDEYVALMERIIAEFADVEFRGATLGPMAEGALFAMEHLAVGKPAPDIEGEDIDGVRFKLSDYRGKVVMLDFWGHW